MKPLLLFFTLSFLNLAAARAEPLTRAAALIVYHGVDCYGHLI